MFELGNTIEAAVWGIIALCFAAAACTRGGQFRSMQVVAAATFVAFGVSDLVEIGTGAWWRPWWLLLWKAACVSVLLALLLRYRRMRG